MHMKFQEAFWVVESEQRWEHPTAEILGVDQFFYLDWGGSGTFLDTLNPW